MFIEMIMCVSVSATGQGVLKRVRHHVKPSSFVECFDFPVIFFLILEPLTQI